MLLQRTLAKKIQVTGIGLHSGKKVTMTLHPALADFGICFKRIDLKEVPILKAEAHLVGATENNTTLGQGENIVHTVEHLLGALYGLGVNNVYCEIDGPEVPIMDGSGIPFVFLIKEAGISYLSQSKKFLIITEKVKVELGDKWAEIEPATRLIINSTIIFPHPQIKTQHRIFEFSCERFVNDIARARTFGMLKDVDMLKRKGLIKGASLDNAIGLDDFRVMNPDGLRFTDEFVRHKILDTLGDISLLGYEVAGKITTYKSGHNLHNMLCRKILDNPNCFQIVSASSLEMETRKSFELPPALVVSY